MERLYDLLEALAAPFPSRTDSAYEKLLQEPATDPRKEDRRRDVLRRHEVREREANIDLEPLNPVETRQWIYTQLENSAYSVKDRTELSNKWMEYGRVLKRVN
jgi:hypothetical protein